MCALEALAAAGQLERCVRDAIDLFGTCAEAGLQAITQDYLC